MTGVEVALLAASVVAAGAGAAVQASSASASANMQAQQAQMRKEQASTELELAKISQREQEAQRRAQADTTASEARVGAIAQGYDPFSSPSFERLDTFNEKQAANDISSISLLGNARRQRLMMEGRGAQMAQDYYQGQAANSWIAPTIGFIGSAGRTAYQGYKGMGANG